MARVENDLNQRLAEHYGISKIYGAQFRKVALSDPKSSRLYHHVERAAEFLVYPGAGTSGLVSFDSRWEVRPAETSAASAAPM